MTKGLELTIQLFVIMLYNGGIDLVPTCFLQTIHHLQYPSYKSTISIQGVYKSTGE